jgi:phosphoribosylanthranilate isomerase
MRLIRIKICGVTTKVDAVQAIGLGADTIGLNFCRTSLRHVTQAEAQSIAQSVISPRAQLVGVFVNNSAEEIRRIAAPLGLAAVQLHGDETPAIMDELRGLPVIRAIRVELPVQSVAEEVQRWESAGANAILLDAARPGQYGGTGNQFDWQIVRALSRSVPIIVAGGLNPENVSLAIAQARPDGVDVASGIELFPGKKDAQSMKRFISAASESFAALA